MTKHMILASFGGCITIILFCSCMLLLCLPSLENYPQIRLGMTLKEAEAILASSPGEHKSLRSVLWPEPEYYGLLAVPPPLLNARFNPRELHYNWWYGDKVRICVVTDNNERVEAVYAYQNDGTLLFERKKE